MDCVYSMSRRLGRPAKKREGQQRPKKERRAQKRAKAAKRKGNEHEDQKSETRGFEGEVVSIEDGLQTPLLGEGSFSDNTMDFSSDSWLQDFVSAPSSSDQDCSLFDALDTPMPAGFKDQSVFLPLSTAADTPDLQASPYVQDTAPSNTNVPADDLTPPPLTAPKLVCPEFLKRNALFDSLPDSLLPPTDQSYSFPDEAFTLSPPFETPSLVCQAQCHCYEQAVRELIRVNNCASQTTHSSIDTILACLRGLQQLVDTVLQCNMCSQTTTSLLMIVIFSIDSLLSILEETTSAVKGRVFDPLSDDDMGAEFDCPIGHGRRYGSASAATTRFEAQIESCPLLVGSFRIPPDDKYCFIKQLLHTRLSGLLAAIRRIRFCTQQILANSSSRGRLIMMMETDRRLQLIMMRTKMYTR
ncbi:hypothetical protein PHISP_03777 [Aspergillus sp. HF37]|nr:hypothetical protein PHISP_03777 [Aspergillus sp. HF37]